ncbi:hypothetical protein EI94DRAFT_1804674 [Lactarius quietus]|nr:hypothetical protein EI94DRAFT_1804674 [Lactarius quietus]
MDNASEIYSLYSSPSTSHGTSATCSADLPTLLDGPTSPKNANPAFVGPRVMPNNKADIVRVYSSSPRSTASRYEDEILEAFPNPPEFRSPQECGPEPYEEYFSIPVPKYRLGLDDARHRRSTKELIKRFESISADNPPVEKKTSPLRQSFRNLLSVFKKGKRSGKEKTDSNGAPSESEPPVERVPSGPLQHDDESDPFTFDGSGPSSRICTSPTYSLHKGPLLHLSPLVPTSSILPVWVACDATLHGSHILLTSATTQGIQSTAVVSLRACTDIRSLAPNEIVAEQRALLPAMEDSTDPKDRAAWVSAIWDVVLHRQERRRLERTKAEIKSSLRVDVRAVSSQPSTATSPLPDNGQILTPPDIPFSDSRIFRNREVPPLPQDGRPTHSASLAALSSLMGNYPQPGLPKVLATSVISVGPRNHINARKNSELASPISIGLRQTLRRPWTLASRGNAEWLDVKQLHLMRSSFISAEHRCDTSSCGRPVEKPTIPVSSRASLNVADSRLPSPVSAVSNPSTLSSTPRSAFRLRDELRTRSLTVAHTHDTSERPSPAPTTSTGMGHQPSEPQAPVGSLSTGAIHSLLDIMDVHAERQLIKTGELDDKLEDVQDGVRDIAANLHVAISVREEDSRNIAELRSAMGNIRSALEYLSTKTGDADVPEQEVSQAVVKSIVPLDGAVDGEAKSSITASEQPSEFLRAGYGTGIKEADVSDIRRKLDMLLELSASQNNAASSATPPSETLQHSERGSQTANGAFDRCGETTMDDTEYRTNHRQGPTISHDEGKGTQLMEQQAESVRYLNELNSWLEAFVNGSTAQFGAIAEDVQKLCKALGSVEELRDSPEGDANADQTAGTMTLLQNVRKLIADNQRRDRDSTHLLSTMNGLAAALNEDMRKNAEMRNAYTTESVLGAIERQRRDQERMLRALASELSDDIRGERLRFVEAMKEATAINVQIHVEEFKKELTREVLISTQEVGRLQRERQLLEQQIADLFAFYSKQKQNTLGAKGDAVPQSRSLQPRLQSLDPKPEQNESPSSGRALPLPPPDRKQRP